jgi:hypothetical protein
VFSTDSSSSTPTWLGTRELAERQARHDGVRFEVVTRQQEDLLDYVEKRGRWPSSDQCYFTSDLSRPFSRGC